MNLDRIVLAGGGPIFEAVHADWATRDWWKAPYWIIPKDRPIRPRDIETVDLLLCIGHPQILTREILDATYCINLHSSLLPRHRGRHPVNWAMIQGDREIGLTLHEMDEDIDTGDILVQWAVPMRPASETYTDVMARLAGIAPGIVKLGLTKLHEDSCIPYAQDEHYATYEPRRTPADSRITWEHDRSPEEAAWFINGQHPDAPAFDDQHVYRRAWLSLHTEQHPLPSPSSPSTASTLASKPKSSRRSTAADAPARLSSARKSSGSKRR